MKSSVWVRMDAWVRYIVPFGITFVLLLLTSIPNRFPGYAGIAPMLPMMGVYYWAIYRPDLLPAWSVFILGMISDILAGMPPGVNTLVLLLVHGVAVSQRRFFLAKTFVVSWWAFALLTGGALGLSWLLVAALTGKPVDPSPVLFQYLLTLGLFPALSWLLAHTQMTLLKDV